MFAGHAQPFFDVAARHCSLLFCQRCSDTARKTLLQHFAATFGGEICELVHNVIPLARRALANA
jgi:hypothetical protein